MAAVLLIEDDEAQRFVARFALKKAGHEVREAGDGVEGLRVAREERPDVIVCDVMMPAVTGYDVLAQLRADPVLASVPVILLTAMSDRKHMRQGMTAGADDYLTKPYRPDELCEAVLAVLARRQVQEEAFRSSVSGIVESALERQKETLGRHYESQLQREINKRWTQAHGATDLHYARAFLLLADLIGDTPAEGETALAERVKQVQQAARDTLYLFGATQVLPYGPKLMAVFAGDAETMTTPVEVRVLRAAVALAKSVPRERKVQVALHAGPVALVAMTDGLHGDQGHALVPGEAVHAVGALEEAAAEQGWRIAASASLAKALADQAMLGRHARTRRGDDGVEVLGIAPAS
ncbi:response regulator [Ramlibacter sp. USB13]|uniref:Response regulator n=1 Tax=Ramlibacter cellulosilyticus TaxID=2764187 RepID=A0A923MV31_9BURK|nr:response regulator [Ramlibacter cellulosilyticus]MBC5785715.1 response regulator [Ramlibacter cellulosilyticus]